jgi:chemotaxis protein MotB
MGRPKKEASPEEVAGAPLWMVTFSDCMNLLLTFFVLLVTFSAFGPEQQERVLNFGNAMRTAFGTPADSGRVQDEGSMMETRQLVGMEQPEQGSERPTESKSRTARSGALSEDLQAADYRNHKVFLIPSEKVFLGRGRALSADGRYFLGVMAAFLREVPGSVVISENGPEGQAGGADLGLSRALIVLEHLISLENLGRERLSIAADSIAPPEDASGSVLAYHRQERMLEIVILEGGVQQ